MKLKDILWVAARVFIGFVFAYAGYSKLTAPWENFRGAIASYEVIPYALVPLIARIMPWFELGAGVFMILGYAPKASAILTAMMSLGFLIVLGASNVLFESGGKDCGCFGEGALIHLTVHQIFLLDLFDFFASLKLASLKDYPVSLDRLLKPRAD